MKPGTRVPLPSAIAKIYEAVADLEERYPGRPFTPDRHLVGSLGEVVAREIFKFDLYPPQTKVMMQSAKFAVTLRLRLQPAGASRSGETAII